MKKYKSDDYKLGAVKYYLKQNDSMDNIIYKYMYLFSKKTVKIQLVLAYDCHRVD